MDQRHETEWSGLNWQIVDEPAKSTRNAVLCFVVAGVEETAIYPAQVDEWIIL